MKNNNLMQIKNFEVTELDKNELVKVTGGGVHELLLGAAALEFSIWAWCYQLGKD